MRELLDLFITIFKINAITFGGGYTIAPVLMEEFVDKRKVISKDEMLDLIALAQSSPGALAVSISLLIGYKLKGIKGAIICILAAVLPPLIVISLVFLFYKEFANNEYVRAALRGMSGVIVAILLVTTYKLFTIAIKDNKLVSCMLALASFVLGFFTNINNALIILSLALFGIVYYYLLEKYNETTN